MARTSNTADKPTTDKPKAPKKPLGPKMVYMILAPGTDVDAFKAQIVSITSNVRIAFNASTSGNNRVASFVVEAGKRAKAPIDGDLGGAIIQSVFNALPPKAPEPTED